MKPPSATARRRVTLLVSSVLFLLAFPGVAVAHAELDVATPKDGATVEGSPGEISGTYVQDLAEGSSLRLLDPSDTVIARGIIDPDDDRRMFIAEIPELAPGTYTVRSTTVSAEDGETDRATWTFTVEAAPTPAPTPSPTPTPVPSASDTPTASPTAASTATPAPTASASPTPTPSAGGDGTGSAGGDVILPIIAAVAILAIGAVWFSRRGRATPGR